MGEKAEALCITSTAADYLHFNAGRTYTIDLEWAKRKDILRYFEVSRTLSEREAEAQVQDGMIIREKEKIEDPKEAEQEKRRQQKILEAEEKAAEKAAYEEEKKRLAKEKGIRKGKEKARKDAEDEEPDPEKRGFFGKKD